MSSSASTCAAPIRLLDIAMIPAPTCRDAASAPSSEDEECRHCPGAAAAHDPRQSLTAPGYVPVLPMAEAAARATRLRGAYRRGASASTEAPPDHASGRAGAATGKAVGLD